MQNPKRPKKNEFLKLIKQTPKKDTQIMCLELLELLDQRLPEIRDLLNTNAVQDMKYIRAEFLKKEILRPMDVFKLYLVAIYPVAEINHWIFTSKQCFRSKKTSPDMWRASIRTTRKKRTKSIRDGNGDVIPMTWRNKHLPAWVESQREYDIYLREQKQKGKSQ